MVNLASFPQDKVTLGFASDIEQRLLPLVGIRQCTGQARYQATTFGWLSGERRARILEAGPLAKGEVRNQILEAARDDTEKLEQYQQLLLQIAPQSDEAFFVEDGEKEYTVEFIWLDNDSVQVLCRYTMGAPDQGDNELARVSDVCVSQYS